MHKSSFSISIISPDVRVVYLVSPDSIYLANVMVGVS